MQNLYKVTSCREKNLPELIINHAENQKHSLPLNKSSYHFHTFAYIKYPLLSWSHCRSVTPESQAVSVNQAGLCAVLAQIEINIV